MVWRQGSGDRALQKGSLRMGNDWPCIAARQMFSSWFLTQNDQRILLSRVCWGARATVPPPILGNAVHHG